MNNVFNNDQVKAYFNLTQLNRAMQSVQTANNNTFDKKCKMSRYVVNFLTKAKTKEGKQLLAEHGYEGTLEDIYRDYFGWGKSNVTKYKKMGTHINNEPNSVEEYKQAIEEFKNETGLNATLGIQAYNFYMDNDKVLKEAHDLENQDEIDLGEEAEETEEAEESTGSNISITIKEGLDVISMFEKDGHFVSSNSASTIANALMKLASEVAQQGVVSASDLA